MTSAPATLSILHETTGTIYKDIPGDYFSNGGCRCVCNGITLEIDPENYHPDDAWIMININSNRYSCYRLLSMVLDFSARRQKIK